MPTKFYYLLGEFPDGFARDIRCKDTQREMTGRTDKYLVGLSSKTCFNVKQIKLLCSFIEIMMKEIRQINT